MSTERNRIICGDCLEVMRGMEEDSVDLVFGSPPYEDARVPNDDPFGTYCGQDWVDWMVEVYQESLRVCRGLVAFVVQGRTRKFKWSATPALLMADLHRSGIHLRDCVFFHRVGVPGSGGPDWLRHDVEYMVCATNGGKLPWSDNVAMGHPPKWAPGGDMSHRMQNGRRVAKLHTKNTGDKKVVQGYNPPKKANPGNLIHCDVGGGRMGSMLSHQNEAPFPETLADFMVLSFCPPGGIVLDPFGGSGTTMASSIKNGRNSISIDVRLSQVYVMGCRLEECLDGSKS